MMKKFLFIFTFAQSFLAFAQIDLLDGYPDSQFFYEKGELHFLKDLQDVAIENNLKPCDNTEEQYQPKWIVYEDAHIAFIKDDDTLNIQKNKCAFDFTKNVFKYLHNWRPVYHNQKTYAAIASYNINPSEIFKLKINDDFTPNYIPAEYRGGNTAFQLTMERLIGPIFSKNYITLNNQEITIRFKISKLGIVEEVKIYPEIPFKIEDEILLAFQKDSKKWKPAMLNGIPKEQRVAFKMHFQD